MVTDKTTTYCLQQMVNKEILLTIIVQKRFNYTYVLFALLNYDICLKYFCLSINLRDICFFEIASVNSVYTIGPALVRTRVQLELHC